MKKKLCLALSGALCLSAGVGCGTETTEETLTPVRLNEVVHSVFYAPQYAAIELGYFTGIGLFRGGGLRCERCGRQWRG